MARTGARGGGVTLIELLVVMGIVLLLASLLVMGLNRGDARRKATLGLLLRLQTALKSYHDAFRDYPPDGYDAEPTPPGGTGWTYDAHGVVVGTPPRGVKGTAALIYFLCRPLNQVTLRGGDPTDPRNVSVDPLRPFLVLTESERSRPLDDPDGEIVDPYGRPLCYDKVRAETPAGLHFQPGRFHAFGATAATLPRGAGRFVHSDQALLDGLSLLDADELACPTGVHDAGLAGLSQAQRLDIHTDPRMLPGVAGSDGCPPPGGGVFVTGFPAGSAATHGLPGGDYYLWSYGRSWVNARDDLCSWR